MKKTLILAIITGLVAAAAILIVPKGKGPDLQKAVTRIAATNAFPKVTPTPYPIPVRALLKNEYQVYQSFNNCGPASLSMALSYFGIRKSQEELGKELRPYQNPQGDNDDKSVTLDELAAAAERHGLVAYHRPNGSMDILKKLIASGVPVITRTWLTPDEDIGHYRVVKGYDEDTKEIIQDDSYQGPNRRYTYNQFDRMWEKFNYEYLVLAPKDKQKNIESMLGEDADPKTAWKHATERSASILATNPDDIYAQFNLSVALYYTGDYSGSVTEYEKVSGRLPKRTLWYQIEPILAYEKLGRYDTVMAMTEDILTHENRAFSELYLLRGDIFRKQGETASAKAEYEKSVYYNTNLKEASERLATLAAQ